MNKKRAIKYLEFGTAIIAIFWTTAILYVTLHRKIILALMFIVAAGYLSAMLFKKAFGKAMHYALKFRWLIALCIFIVCVSFRIHGSSIGVYDQYFPTHINDAQAQDYRIWGQDRTSRSDEWGVHTPIYFSQRYNDYKMESRQMGISETNMVLDYYAPVKSVTVIGKPFLWGYLLFGNEVGLSWYWCGMTLLMFLTAFEMFMILTQKNVRLSAVGMLMVGLSPVMQWWFIPHVTIIFIYAMGLFDVGYYFFTAKRKCVQWAMAFLAAFAIIGFALSLFPSCQYIAALVVSALLIGCLARDREKITFTAGQWHRIGVVALIAGGALGDFIFRHWPEFSKIMNTVYPGRRISVGGEDTLYEFFTDLTSIYLPYKDPAELGSSSELASYIHFGPMFIVLFPRMSKFLKEKGDRNELIGRILCVILLIQIEFMCAGFSRTLAKITLFKYVYRMNLSYEWTATVFTIWSFYMIAKHKGMFKRWQTIVYPALYGLLFLTFINKKVMEYMPLRFQIIEILLFVLILALTMARMDKAASYAIAGMMCVAGLTVNPLCRGTAPISNHPISEFIREKAQSEPDAWWMTVDALFVVNNFVMANGAKVIGATSFYPDTERWRLLDPDGKYEEAYNRYANQTISLVDGETSVDLIVEDSVRINMNPDDVKKMHVKYIVTASDLQDILGRRHINCAKVFEQDGYMIYQLAY